MTQPIYQRMNYHPDPREISTSDRKVKSRLDFILSKVDFKNKVVLDLGCSGGYFSFELAKIAKKVVAVDGDHEIIARNKELQKELGIDNIEFICSSISAEFLANIGNVDITLFLSVYHHMMTISDAYDWNNAIDSEHRNKMLSKINQITKCLVFEMGEVNEGYEWCQRMPVSSKNNKDYVTNEVFKESYVNVNVYDGPVKVNLINKYLVSKLSQDFKEDTKLVSIFKRIFMFDARDLRKVYVGQK